jgi:plastocyanin
MKIYMYHDISVYCMKTLTVIILLCCISIMAVLVAGCTSQPSPPVTTVTTTIVPTAVTTITQDTRTTPVTQTTVATTGTQTGATTTSPGVTTPSPTEDNGQRIRIKARNLAFDVSRITVPASSQVIIEFENEDALPHNVAFYTTSSLAATIYKGAIITGPREITYTFTAPAIPGTYYFRCDVHPDMDGQFVVT